MTFGVKEIAAEGDQVSYDLLVKLFKDKDS